MTVREAIAVAEAILPGIPLEAESGADPRWQAIIAVGEFIDTHPDDVWEFAATWGCVDDADLQMAVATCLVEHLLEEHFDRVFPRVEQLALTDERFAHVFRSCWRFGQSDVNVERFDALRRACEEKWSRG